MPKISSNYFRFIKHLKEALLVKVISKTRHLPQGVQIKGYLYIHVKVYKSQHQNNK